VLAIATAGVGQGSACAGQHARAQSALVHINGSRKKGTYKGWGFFLSFYSRAKISLRKWFVFLLSLGKGGGVQGLDAHCLWHS